MDFDAAEFPRTRSYLGADEFLDGAWAGHANPVPRTRFAGWIAAAFGADRQLLGSHPSLNNVEALVHKALMQSGVTAETAELVFIVDSGAKAEAVMRYVERSPHAEEFLTWRFQRTTPEPVRVECSSHVLDSASCAIAGLPPKVRAPGGGPVLLVDIGYFRTKLHVMSDEGCEYQELVDGLGVSDCVRRVLRDEQDQGLVEDEFAVMAALERNQRTIDVAGRRYDIERSLESAKQSLEEELVHAVRRALLEHFKRRGAACRRVALVGGGGALLRGGLGPRLERAELGLSSVWASGGGDFLPALGAQRLFLPERRT
jgi:hypothetical protein